MMQIRGFQEKLAVEAPDDTRSLFGEAVEASSSNIENTENTEVGKIHGSESPSPVGSPFKVQLNKVQGQTKKLGSPTKTPKSN